MTTADPVDARLHALYVPSCNEYLVAIRHCFEKGSPEARAALEKDLLVSADAWVLAARTPKGQNGLSVACTIATREIVRNGDKCPR